MQHGEPLKIEFKEIARASGSAELTFHAGNATEAAKLFSIYAFLRDYSGELALRTSGTSGTLREVIEL